MRTTEVQSHTFFTRLFGLNPNVESKKYATEAEIVEGLTGCTKHRDYQSKDYAHCPNCQKDTLTRVRGYGLSEYFSTIDCGDIITKIRSCSVCDTLYEPEREHRYGYSQE